MRLFQAASFGLTFYRDYRGSFLHILVVLGIGVTFMYVKNMKPEVTMSQAGQDERFVQFVHYHNFNWSDVVAAKNGAAVLGPVFATRIAESGLFHRWRLRLLPKGGQSCGSSADSCRLFHSFAMALESTTNHSMEAERVSFLVVSPATASTQKTLWSGVGYLLNDPSQSHSACFIDLKAARPFVFRTFAKRRQKYLRLGVQFSLRRKHFDPLEWLPADTEAVNKATEPDDHTKSAFANIDKGWDESGANLEIVAADGQTFHVNSLYLQSVPYFRATLKSKEFKRSGDRKLVLDDFNGATVYEALRFLYLHQIGDAVSEQMPEVLRIFAVWGLETPLTTVVERQLVIAAERQPSRLLLKQLITYLDWADTYHMHVLRRVCLSLLADNLEMLHSRYRLAYQYLEEERSQLITELFATANQLGRVHITDDQPRVRFRDWIGF